MSETNPSKTRGQLLRFREAAALLGVSSRTIDRNIKAGHLPTVRLPGGHRRVDLRDVDALITERKSDRR